MCLNGNQVPLTCKDPLDSAVEKICDDVAVVEEAVSARVPLELPATKLQDVVGIHLRLSSVFP